MSFESGLRPAFFVGGGRWSWVGEVGSSLLEALLDGVGLVF
jgi:hypothetical protein